MASNNETTVSLDGRSIPLDAGMSVLEGLERDGLKVASGCRAGTCCKCMLQAEDPPPESQKGLRPTLRAQGFFLACQARPSEPLRLIGTQSSVPLDAEIEATQQVGPGVARLLIRPSKALQYSPGQYLAVLHPSGAERSYSIASLPSTGLLELHVRLIPGGLVSTWMHSLTAGARLQIRGPFGQCYYLQDDPLKKHLLVGAGTGLAPLLGIARDALHQGHAGPLLLLHGGLEPGRLYLREELSALAEKWPQLEVHHCVMRDATAAEHEGSLDEVAIRLAGPLAGVRTFLCGDGALVKQLQRSLFLAGAASSEILADPFLPTT